MKPLRMVQKAQAQYKLTQYNTVGLQGNKGSRLSLLVSLVDAKTASENSDFSGQTLNGRHVKIKHKKVKLIEFYRVRINSINSAAFLNASYKSHYFNIVCQYLEILISRKLFI